jgi:hypothetical protein
MSMFNISKEKFVDITIRVPVQESNKWLNMLSTCCKENTTNARVLKVKDAPQFSLQMVTDVIDKLLPCNDDK